MTVTAEYGWFERVYKHGVIKVNIFITTKYENILTYRRNNSKIMSKGIKNCKGDTR